MVECESFLWKRGDKGVRLHDTFKRRYFRVDGEKGTISYYKDSDCGSKKGKIAVKDIMVVQHTPAEKYHQSAKVAMYHEFGLTVRTLPRNYYLVAENVDIFSEWVHTFAQLIGRSKVDHQLFDVIKGVNVDKALDTDDDSDKTDSDDGPPAATGKRASIADVVSSDDSDDSSVGEAAGGSRGVSPAPAAAAAAPEESGDELATLDVEEEDRASGRAMKRRSTVRPAARSTSSSRSGRPSSMRAAPGKPRERAMAAELRALEKQKKKQEQELALARQVIEAAELRVAELEGRRPSAAAKMQLDEPLLGDMGLVEERHASAQHGKRKKYHYDDADEDDGNCECGPMSCKCVIM